jgi:hypothetical protein
MPGYSLELETIKRLGKMLKAFEGGGMAPTLREHLTESYEVQGVAVRVVQVTGAKQSDGTYPAKLLGRNSEAYSATWSDYEVVSVIEPNGASLTNGNKYVALCVGWYEGSGSVSGGSSGSAAGLWVVAGSVSSTGSTLTQSVVTDVTCSGSTLVVTKKTLTIPGGTVSSGSGSGSP